MNFMCVKMDGNKVEVWGVWYFVEVEKTKIRFLKQDKYAGSISDSTKKRKNGLHVSYLETSRFKNDC